MKKIVCLIIALVAHINAYQVVVTNTTSQLIEVVMAGNSPCASLIWKVKPGEQGQQQSTCCPKEIRVQTRQGVSSFWRRDITKTCNEDDLFVVRESQGQLTIKEQRPATGYEVIMNNMTGGMLNIRVLYQDSGACSFENFEHKVAGKQSFSLQESCCPQTIEVQMMEQDSKNPPQWYTWNKNILESCTKSDQFDVARNRDGTLNFKRVGQ